MHRYPLLLMLLAVMPVCLAAQQGQALTRGTRVRLERQFVGTISDLSGDTLVVQGADADGSESRSIAVQHIGRLEVSQGRKSNWLTGGLLGAVAGGVGGLVTGNASCEEDDFIFTLRRGQCIGITAMGFAVLGAGVGALIGAFIKTERWEQVPIRNLRLSVTPRRGGVTLGISVAY